MLWALRSLSDVHRGQDEEIWELQGQNHLTKAAKGPGNHLVQYSQHLKGTRDSTKDTQLVNDTAGIRNQSSLLFNQDRFPQTAWLPPQMPNMVSGLLSLRGEAAGASSIRLGKSSLSLPSQHTLPTELHHGYCVKTWLWVFLLLLRTDPDSDLRLSRRLRNVPPVAIKQPGPVWTWIGFVWTWTPGSGEEKDRSPYGDPECQTKVILNGWSP